MKIPAGVQTGSKVRLAGQGAAGIQGGPPGDLYIETQVAEHPLVRREGDDLYIDLPVTVSEAMLGRRGARAHLPGRGDAEGAAGLAVRPAHAAQGAGRARRSRADSAGDLYLTPGEGPRGRHAEARAAAETLARAYRGNVRRAQLYRSCRLSNGRSLASPLVALAGAPSYMAPPTSSPASSEHVPMGIFDFLGGSGPEKALKLKSKVTQKYGDPSTRQKALQQLGEMKFPEAVTVLLSPLHHHRGARSPPTRTRRSTSSS